MFLVVSVLFLSIGGSCDLQLSIYNGTEENLENFPYLVSLQSIRGHFCVGVIYDTDLIITAARCLESRKPEEVHIVAGRTKATRSNEERNLTAHSFLLHPNYFRNNTVVRNDIALVRTNSRFSWSNAVQASMINSNWTYSVNEGINVVGWDETKKKEESSDTFLSAVFNVQNNDECKKAFPRSYEPESTFCLYSEGRDACRKDGGSPTINQHNQIVGLVSYAGKLCGTKPFVATRINYYFPWIEKQRKQINHESGEDIDPVNSVNDAELTTLYASFIQRQTLEHSHEEVCGSTWKLNCLGKECFCYTLLQSRLTWLEAGERCGRYGGALTSITSEEENDFVGKFVPSRHEDQWIGLNDLESRGKFAWPDQILNYTKWHIVDEADIGTNRRTCVSMDYSIGWKKSNCDKNLKSVCKAPVHEGDCDRSCQTGWFSFGEYCYQMQASLLTWNEASRNCEKKQAQLASISSPFENELVLAVIADAGKDYVWIGLNDQKVEGNFVWSDNSLVKFKRWHEGQPNSHWSEENCVAVWMPSGLWHDYNCLLKFPSLCKKMAF